MNTGGFGSGVNSNSGFSGGVNSGGFNVGANPSFATALNSAALPTAHKQTSAPWSYNEPSTTPTPWSTTTATPTLWSNGVTYNHFLEKYREEMKKHYNNIAQKYPEKKKFLKGWLNRANSAHLAK